MDRQIYFCDSIRAGREDQPLYAAIVAHLAAKYGNVLTCHVADKDVAADKGLDEFAICARDEAWMEAADVVVAEVTIPSLGVGVELGLAQARKLPILCLFREKDAQKKLSAMIAGNRAMKVVIYEDIASATAAIDEFFASL